MLLQSMCGTRYPSYLSTGQADCQHSSVVFTGRTVTKHGNSGVISKRHFDLLAKYLVKSSVSAIVRPMQRHPSLCVKCAGFATELLMKASAKSVKPMVYSWIKNGVRPDTSLSASVCQSEFNDLADG